MAEDPSTGLSTDIDCQYTLDHPLSSNRCSADHHHDLPVGLWQLVTKIATWKRAAHNPPHDGEFHGRFTRGGLPVAVLSWLEPTDTLASGYRVGWIHLFTEGYLANAMIMIMARIPARLSQPPVRSESGAKRSSM